MCCLREEKVEWTGRSRRSLVTRAAASSLRAISQRSLTTESLAEARMGQLNVIRSFQDHVARTKSSSPAPHSLSITRSDKCHKSKCERSLYLC